MVWLGEELNDDQELAERCLAGRESAYYEFVERFQGLVFGVCLRMLGDRHEAEDIAQEVLLRALRGLKGWDSQRPLRPWLLTIATNRCRTQLARRTKRPVATEYFEDVADHRNDGSDARELQSEIARALATLRADYRQVFLLFHEQGLSYQEMSEVVGKPIGTLKTWLHRARNEMLAQLRQKGLAPENRNDVSKV